MTTAAFDIDGTIDAFPGLFRTIMTALHNAGCQVLVLTGSDDNAVTQQDIDDKRSYLGALGINASVYDGLIVCPKPVADNKAQAIKDHDIDVLFDNDVKNAKACKPECAVLLLWNSKEK